MTQKLSPWIRNQFFDGNGDPLAGGFVHFYVAGSTSLRKNTYEDYLGSTANENPVELDSTGVAKIFGSGLYDVVITDANGVLIETVRGADFGGSDSEFGTYIVVDNYAALRGLAEDYDAVYVLGRDVPNDGGQGMFLRSTKNDADDDGIILVRNSSTRYFRVLSETVNPLWYGCKYSTVIDNSSAFTAAINGGIAFNLPVSVDGALYFASNYSIKSGARIILNGSFYGVPGISITFKNGSKLISAAKNAFAASINPQFEDGVSDYLKVSWFAGSIYQAIKSSVENYSLLVDKDTTLQSNLEVPLNFAVDFVGGAKLIVKSLIDLTIHTLKYSDAGQIVVYQSKAYIGAVKMGEGYCYLEWFGGKASSSLDSGNDIAFTAALKHGKIYLVSNVPDFYNIQSGAYVAPNGLVLFGNYIPNNSNVNDAVQSTLRLASGATLTVSGGLTLNGVKIDGQGSISAQKTSIVNSIISNTISASSKLGKVNDILATNASFVTVGIYGRAARTNDVNAGWTPVTTGYLQNFTSVAKGKSLFVASGQNGLISTSTDGSAWTQRSSNVTATLNEVKWIESTGKFVAVGEAGTLIHSVNGIDWVSQDTPMTTIRSVAYFNGKYVIVGDSGKIYTSTDLIVWTLKVATGVTGTLYSADASGSLLTIVGYNGTIVTSTDAVSFTLRLGPVLTNLFTVKYYADSALWVAAGAAGVILKSTDGLTYSQIKTYTDNTDSIFDQTMANAEYVFVGGAGKVITSYDLSKFVATTPLSAQDFYGVAAAPSMVLAIGDAGAISASLDGFNYTLLTSGTTENLNRIKLIWDKYVICANNGKYLYSVDGINWTVGSISTSKNLMDVVVNSDSSLFVAVGSNGLVATTVDPFAATPVWVIENIYSTGTTPLDQTIRDIIYDETQAVYKYTIAGDSGISYYSTDGHTWTGSESGSTDYRMIKDGATYWSVGDLGSISGLYKGTTGIGGTYVETRNTKFTRVAKVGSNIVLFGDAGVSVIEYSSDEFATYKFNEISSNEYTITAVAQVLVNGNQLTLFATSNGEILVGNVVPATLTATEISIDNSIVGIDITNTISGNVSDSEILNVTLANKVVGSKIGRFSGSVNNLISRSEIDFIQSIGIKDDCFIGDSTLTNINEDKNIGVFSADAGVTGISINNTTVNAPKSLLVYSENTSLKININGGVIYNGNGIALSNGFAKVFTNGVFDENANLVKNVSAYSIEGHILEAELTEIQAPQTITSSKDHWYGEVAKVDLEGDHFKVNAPIYLSSAPYGASTLRYRFGSDAMRAMRSFGGRIKTTIKFPAGADKVEQLASRVKALFFIPSYIVDCYDNNGHLYYRNGTNDAFTAGKTLAGSSSVDGATIINYTNVWAGREALNQQLPVIPETDVQNKNVCRDDFGDYSFPAYLERTLTPFGFKKSDYLLGEDKTFLNSNLQNVTLEGDLTFEAYIVIVNESIAALPIGTTIKVELIPSLPKTIETFNAYFEAPQFAVDSYNGREKQFLQFRDFSTGDLKLAFRAKSTSVTWNVELYKTAPNYYYNFTPASGPEGQFATTYDPKSKLWDLIVDVKIDIENLNWTGAQTIPKYHFSPAYDPEYYTASQIFTLP